MAKLKVGIHGMMYTKKEISEMSLEKLMRKYDQHWDMYGLALHDNDMKDAERHYALTRKLREEIELRRSGDGV